MKGVATARGEREEKLLATLGAEEGSNLLARWSRERLRGLRIGRWRWFLTAEAVEEEERDEGRAKRREERKEKKRRLLEAREERSRVAPSIIFVVSSLLV